VFEGKEEQEQNEGTRLKERIILLPLYLVQEEIGSGSRRNEIGSGACPSDPPLYLLLYNSLSFFRLDFLT